MTSTTEASTAGPAVDRLSAMTEAYIKVAARLQQVGADVEHLSIHSTSTGVEVVIYPRWKPARSPLADLIVEAFDLDGTPFKHLGAWSMSGDWAGVRVTVNEVTPPDCTCDSACAQHSAGVTA